MRLQKKMFDPLEDHIPSLFFVTSPFQAMCALEAIQELDIADYKIYVCQGNDARDSQLYRYLDEAGVDYLKCDYNWSHFFMVCLYPLFCKRKAEYHRAFLGDSENTLQFHFAYRYLSPNSLISFVDDGTKDIPILAGRRKRKTNRYSWAEWLIRKVLNIRTTRSYFTLFSDIASSKFECRKNTFAHLSKGNDEKNPYGVYFVGTNSIQYCKKLKIGINQFIDSLEKQILYIRKIYVDQPIYFIPHGRDSNEAVKLMCEKHHVVYLPVTKSVELYMLSLSTKPVAVYANTSTALFNLKLLYPDVDIYNIFNLGTPESSYYADYVMYSEYFAKHGIEWIKDI